MEDSEKVTQNQDSFIENAIHTKQTRREGEKTKELDKGSKCYENERASLNRTNQSVTQSIVTRGKKPDFQSLLKGGIATAIKMKKSSTSEKQTLEVNKSANDKEHPKNTCTSLASKKGVGKKPDRFQQEKDEHNQKDFACDEQESVVSSRDEISFDENTQDSYGEGSLCSESLIDGDQHSCRQRRCDSTEKRENLKQKSNCSFRKLSKQCNVKAIKAKKRKRSLSVSSQGSDRSHKDGERPSKKRKIPNRPGIVFELGAKLEAKDFQDKWYPAKIIAIDDDDCEVLVHYERWSARFDEWMSMDSPCLRPLHHAHTRKEEKERSGKQELKHKVGDEVLARWADRKMYPAKISEIYDDGTYKVLFYDGFHRKVQPINVHKLPPELVGQVIFPPSHQLNEANQDDSSKSGKKTAKVSKKCIEGESKTAPVKKASNVSKESKPTSMKKKKKTHEFEVGEEVFAKSKNGKMYHSKIIKLLEDGCYSVLFYDGTQNKVNANNIQKLPQKLAEEMIKEIQVLMNKLIKNWLVMKKKRKKHPISLQEEKKPGHDDLEFQMNETTWTATSKEIAEIKCAQKVAPKEFVIEEDHNHYKCHIVGCGKSFRKENLLQSHIKHYHSKGEDSSKNGGKTLTAGLGSTSRNVTESVGTSPSSSYVTVKEEVTETKHELKTIIDTKDDVINITLNENKDLSNSGENNLPLMNKIVPCYESSLTEKSNLFQNLPGNDTIQSLSSNPKNTTLDSDTGNKTPTKSKVSLVQEGVPRPSPTMTTRRQSYAETTCVKSESKTSPRFETRLSKTVFKLEDSPGVATRKTSVQVENKKKEKSCEVKLVDNKKKEKICELKQPENKKKEKLSELKQTENKKKEKSIELKHTENKKKEKLSEVKQTENKKKEKASEMKQIENKKKEKAIEPKQLENKKKEKSNEIKQIENKKKEKPNEIKQIENKKKEKPNEIKQIESKKKEKVSDIKQTENKKEENRIEQRQVYNKKKDKSSEFKQEESKKKEKISDWKQEKTTLTGNSKPKIETTRRRTKSIQGTSDITPSNKKPRIKLASDNIPRTERMFPEESTRTRTKSLQEISSDANSFSRKRRIISEPSSLDSIDDSLLREGFFKHEDTQSSSETVESRDTRDPDTSLDMPSVTSKKTKKTQSQQQEYWYEGEVVHCICESSEESGLMMQCEVCLAWQHGDCFDIEEEKQVPQKYVCYACLEPKGQRESFRYKHDQDWFKTGQMTTFSFLNKDALQVSQPAAMKASHDLTASLHDVFKVLHSVKYKLKVLEDDNHPDLKKFSKPWHEVNKDKEVISSETLQPQDVKTEVPTSSSQPLSIQRLFMDLDHSYFSPIKPLTSFPAKLVSGYKTDLLEQDGREGEGTSGELLPDLNVESSSQQGSIKQHGISKNTEESNKKLGTTEINPPTNCEQEVFLVSSGLEDVVIETVHDLTGTTSEEVAAEGGLQFPELKVSSEDNVSSCYETHGTDSITVSQSENSSGKLWSGEFEKEETLCNPDPEKCKQDLQEHIVKVQEELEHRMDLIEEQISALEDELDFPVANQSGPAGDTDNAAQLLMSLRGLVKDLDVVKKFTLIQ
ncbi:PHD finger protein 20-like protein 1 [Limulus polyphemus]|uniref:PHD finger protein 20-like protein 1 n=1 Tax=Limulus polyphemus TaxID=6850 RepID=A0ABM1C0M0_LIMPO|nr:PHD finger protein 20-like protein 1 [Limulus polyphemus]